MKLTRSGFSLVETLFSVSILLIVIVAAILAITSSTFLIAASRNLVTASGDAQYALEQIRALSFDDIPAYIAGYPSDYFGNLPQETVSFPNPVYTANLDTITIQISWEERNAQKDLSITTRMAR